MTNSVVVITGASQGIGRSTAVRLARDFKSVVLEHWASIHGMTAAAATERFPQEAGIARYGEPEEIAELMAFLVSPGARWMTGSTLRMDGGKVKSI